jgi:enamine deaminase RidA (YjgF/YER057c/UK114 family)
MVSRVMPPQLGKSPGYSYAAVTDSERLVFTAGAVPLDANGDLVGRGSHRQQTEQVLANLEIALNAAGAGGEDVLKTTIYVVAHEHEQLLEVWNVVRDSFVGQAAATLLGVSMLGYQDQLVEIEAIAVAP